MTGHPESNIIFYSFFGFLILIGLVFSRSMDKDVNHYFSTGLSTGGGSISYSIFLLALFQALMIMIPNIAGQSLSAGTIFLISVAAVVPMLFGKQMKYFAEKLSDYNSRTASMFLNSIGLIFLCSVQLLVLVQVADFVIIQFFGSSQYSMLVVMIVATGIYVMAGGLKAVLYANIITGSLSIISLFFVIANAMLWKYQLFFSFRTAFHSGSDIFRVSGFTETNLVIVGIGIVLMMYWMTGLSVGELLRMAPAAKQNIFSRKLFMLGVVVCLLLVGVLFLTTTGTEFDSPVTVNLLNPIDYFVAIGFLGGLMGIFAITFHMASSIVALRLYPSLKSEVGEEEQILVGRLSTVFVVLLSIILISFVKISGFKTFIWYNNFIAFFFTPITAALISTMIVKKGAAIGFIFGMLTGETYAVIEFISQQFEIHPSVLQSTSPYAFAIEIAFVSLFAGMVAAKTSEMVIIQKIFSRIKILRSTML